MQKTFFEPEPTGAELRDAGMERVISHEANYDDFLRKVVLVIEQDFRGMEVTFGEITARCKERGIHPRHPNAWGATCNSVIKRRPGLLTPTGRFVKSRNKKNHAHPYPVYRVAGVRRFD